MVAICVSAREGGGFQDYQCRFGSNANICSATANAAKAKSRHSQRNWMNCAVVTTLGKLAANPVTFFAVRRKRLFEQLK
jgi:hypothetical protein